MRTMPVLIRTALVGILIGAAICLPIVVVGTIAGWSSGAIGSAVVGGSLIAALIADAIYNRELRKLGRR